jgi:hypothetical protein
MLLMEEELCSDMTRGEFNRLLVLRLRSPMVFLGDCIMTGEEGAEAQ